jgi:long-subunit fatty acid transport protein
MGVTLTYHAGSYSYDRRYSEEDRDRFYETYPYDFGSLLVDEFIEDDIAGFSARFGVHYRGDVLRFGLVAMTPTWYSVKETFGIASAKTTFDDGTTEPANSRFATRYYTEYDVTTPWVLSGGLAVVLGEFLVLSGSADMRDYATMEFSNATPEVLALNNDIRTTFRTTVNLRAGAELQIPLTTVRVRAGAMLLPSPYKDDPASFDRKYITGGAGILFGGNVMLEAAYAYGWWESIRANDVASSVTEVITSQTVMIGLSYRF